MLPYSMLQKAACLAECGIPLIFYFFLLFILSIHAFQKDIPEEQFHMFLNFVLYLP